MANVPDMEVNLTGELIEWKPPNYQWETFGKMPLDQLKIALNNIDKDGWEVFQIIQDESSKTFLIIARKAIEEE